MSHIGNGTDAFIAGCLAAAKVVGTVERWSLERYRAHYFSEYPDEDEAWEDRWPVAYRIHAEMREGVAVLGDDLDGKYSCDAVDGSWTSAMPHANAPDARCLVLVDFASDAPLEDARAVVAERIEGSRVGTAIGTFRQLELDLGMRTKGFYEGGDGLARELIAMCRDMGGHTHYFESRVAKLRAGT